MRSAGWWLCFCALAACGGQSGRGDEDGDDDDSSAATGGNVGTGGNATTGGSGAIAGTSGTAGGPAEWAVVCSLSANVSCQKWIDCSPHLAELVLPANCESSLSVDCMSTIRLQGVTISPTEYQACIEAFDRMSCDDWLYGGGVFEECQGFSGTRPNGSPCGAGLQCASGNCSVSGGCGVCEPLSAVGESCQERLCAIPLQCGLDGICHEARYLGDPCTDDLPCVTALICEGGVCLKRGAEGTPCAAGDVLACDLLQGLTCGETLLCEPIAIPGVGEACNGDICATGAVCDEAGRCVAALREGAACTLDEVGDHFCDPSLECIQGVCARFDPASCG